MKKILLSLFFCASATLHAQTTLTTAVDFTATDIDGNTFHLFDKLDSGKFVMLDFMFTNCGPCQVTAPKLHGAFVNYGSNSPSSQVLFVSINRDDNNAVMHTWESTYLNPTGPYPLGISGTQGSATAGPQTFHIPYGIGAFPTMILIAPNHQIVETDMWPIASAATFTTYFQSHGLFPTGIKESQKENNLFSISPVPASDALTINSKNKNMQQIKVMDMIGNVVYLEKLVNQLNTQTIDISKLASGIYFAEIRLSNNEVSIQKFVKE
jgi:thiol-disulfide isomerase/thioredoxin